MTAGSFWDQECPVLLFFFLLLELKRAVKKLCYLNILSGKNTYLNVYYRQTESRLKMWGGGNSSVSNSASVFEVKAFCMCKSYPSFFFSFIGITSMLLEKKYCWKATEWEFLITFKPISKLFKQSFCSVIFHPFYQGKLGLLQFHLRGKLPDPGGLFATAVHQ